MKLLLKIAAYILIVTTVVFSSCKKEIPAASFINSPPPPPPPSLAKGVINFHIKDTNPFGFGMPIYLYRIISYPTFNIYGSTQNIYLRPNIDATFIYTVGGNTSNLFIVGIPDPDEISVYMESRYIVAGTNVNWAIKC